MVQEYAGERRRCPHVRHLGLALCLVGCGRSAGMSAAPSAPDADAVPVIDAATATRLSDESTIAVAGAALLVSQGKIKDPDAPLLVDAMRSAYARMRKEEDEGRVRVRDAERLLLAPPGEAPSRVALVFLHGYGGRFALPCWQIARTVAPLGVTTVCPSIGVEGDWWSEEGERVVTRTVNTLRGAGFRRIALAGLSNGATGVARLAPRLAVDGVILVSGADPVAPAPGVPALVVQGRRDAMSGADRARTYAKKAHATYVELDAGHFAMLLKSDEAEHAVSAFVQALSPGE